MCFTIRMNVRRDFILETFPGSSIVPTILWEYRNRPYYFACLNCCSEGPGGSVRAEGWEEGRGSGGEFPMEWRL